MIKFSLFSSRYLLGLYIGLDSARAVLFEQRGGVQNPVKHFKVNYTSGLNQEDSYQPVEMAINKILDHFQEELESDFIPVQVALADTLVSSAIFELDQIPAKQSMKDKLLAMRFQKDCHIDMQDAAIASQVIAGDKQRGLYAITAPEALISLIQNIFSKRNQSLSCIDKSIHYVFNHYYDQLSNQAAMLFVNDKYWSLVIWNSNKNVVYFRSKLLTINEQLTVVADDVVRLLHTYQANENQPVTQLYVIEQQQDANAISEIIKQKGDITTTSLSRVADNAQLEISNNDPVLYAGDLR